MTKQHLKIACCLMLAVIVAGVIAVPGWLVEEAPRPPPMAFDVMLDSASPKTHPCAAYPNRACMSVWLFSR